MKAVEPIIAKSISPQTDGLALILAAKGEVVFIAWERCSNRIACAKIEDRVKCELSPGGYGIHWPTLDEDLSVGGLLRSKEVGCA